MALWRGCDSRLPLALPRCAAPGAMPPCPLRRPDATLTNVPGAARLVAWSHSYGEAQRTPSRLQLRRASARRAMQHPDFERLAAARELT